MPEGGTILLICSMSLKKSRKIEKSPRHRWERQPPHFVGASCKAIHTSDSNMAADSPRRRRPAGDLSSPPRREHSCHCVRDPPNRRGRAHADRVRGVGHALPTAFHPNGPPAGTPPSDPSLVPTGPCAPAAAAPQPRGPPRPASSYEDARGP